MSIGIGSADGRYWDEHHTRVIRRDEILATVLYDTDGTWTVYAGSLRRRAFVVRATALRAAEEMTGGAFS